MTQKAPITELDFFSAREQLKTFLQQQDRFKDYNFEGSNMAVLLDVLAYNTYQNNFYNNMAISEMFLDSAQRDASVSSHAKTLNYLPKSKRSAQATISFDISVSGSPSFITIPARTRFTAKDESGTAFSFHTDRAYTITPDSRGTYSAKCIEVFEGEYVAESYSAVSDDNRKYQITNEDVDVSSLRVDVTDQETGTVTEFRYTSNIFGVQTTDNVFYLQKSFGNYEVYFGRNIFGNQPSVGDNINISYRVTEGTRANGVVRFALSGTIAGGTISPIKIDGPSKGGSDEESITDVKFYAPKSIQVQERAVTESDYEQLLKSRFPEIRAVSVMGGERLSPPKYGRVAVFIDLRDQNALSINFRENVERYLREKVPLGITPFVEKPNYMFMEARVNIEFDPSKTNMNEAAIRQVVRNSILNFSQETMDGFGKPLRLSKLISAIDNSDPNIVSNQTRVRAILEVNPDLTRLNSFELDFGNELTPIADYALRSLQSQVPKHPVIPKLESERGDRYPTVVSTNFRLGNNTVYIRDDGFGTMQVIRSTEDRDVIVNRNVGSINYKTGKVIISRLRVTSFRGVFKFFADTRLNDIQISKDKISRIRDEDIAITVRSVATQ